MRVLMLPRYDALGASSRLRMMQYVPALQAAGIEVEVSPLLDNAYVRGLYAGKVSVPAVAHSYWQRLRRARAMDQFDVVWLEKEAWPWLPDWLELPLLGRSTKLVVDYDDAVFHRYDAHRSPIVRAILGNKIDQVMRGAKRKSTRYFGPYSHAWAIRETVDLLLRVFPMRSCSAAV